MNGTKLVATMRAKDLKHDFGIQSVRQESLPFRLHKATMLRIRSSIDVVFF